MVRAKVGTRMSHISVISDEVDSSWVTDHYNGLLTTVRLNTDNMLDEDDVILLTEDSVSLELNITPTDIEITSIGFVADESESSNSTAGQFVA